MATLSTEHIRPGPAPVVPHALLIERLEAAVARARHEGRSAAVLLVLDVDGFTAISSSYGRAAADHLLAAVADRLRECLYPQDSLARYGCDEFCVLLRCTSDGPLAATVSERIRRQLAAPFELEGHLIALSASVGITRVVATHASAADVCGEAYAAVHHAKMSGGNQCALFDPSMHEATRARLQLEGELRHAFERGEYVLHYMPIISASTGRLVSLEALMRWEHPVRGCLPPSEFLDALLATGLVMEVARWLVREACEQLVRWREVLPSIEPHISINVSPRQLVDPRFVDDVSRILDDTGVPPSSLAFEITEDLALSDAENAVAVLSALKARGIRVRLDDFGTGYSSLSYLQRLPVHGLKIDRSFLDHFEADPNRGEIVGAIIRLAHVLGLDVVAEGVECEVQAEALRALGCDLLQGFHVSRPLSSDAALDWMVANHAT